MKYCPSCNIKIEGRSLRCPLCQNGLLGEGSEDVYPSASRLKSISILYKLQLFISISLMLVALSMEFLLNKKAPFHWSLLFVVWVIGGQLWIKRILNHHNNFSKVITSCGGAITLLVFLTFLILDLSPIYLTWILPAIVLGCNVLHFIAIFIDHYGNAMPHLLVCSLSSFAIGSLLTLYFSTTHHLWVACILFGVISIIGAIIFRGRTVSMELIKRFHI